MKTETLVRKCLPQNQDIEVLVSNYKEPILPVNHGGFGWYGLMAYNEQGQLMCHQCGQFWDELGRHLRKHELNPRAYKERYGLRMTRRLTSASAHIKHHQEIVNRSGHEELIAKLQAGKDNFRKVCQKPMPKASLEDLNARDTCPQQILRRLIDASKIYGPAISAKEASHYDGGLIHLTKLYFGSFNKAKQLAKLITINISENRGDHAIFTKTLILEDMCAFFGKYGRWPKRPDYKAGLLICSTHPINKNGGFKVLRPEAMKLRQEQEDRRSKGDQIVQYANKIEMEFAGTARR